MNPKNLRKLGLALLGAAAFAVSSASAIVLDFSVSGIGTYTPASQANNNADATVAVNAVIAWYNGGTNPNGSGIVYSLVPGSGVPATGLPTNATFNLKDETVPFQDIAVPTYTYLLGKYGNVAYIFYLGNLAPGAYSLPATLGGGGLSHELAFTTTSVTVPDGGVSLTLLGGALLLLGLARRRFQRA